MTKIYAVTFMEYTNCIHDTVSNGEKDFSKIEYLHIPSNEQFLIREDEIEKYSKYGNGIRDLYFVGYMNE